MSSINLVNYLLDNISKLKSKFSFMDESDSSFLKEYFENTRILFLLMDNLEKYENDKNFNITDTQFDEVTNSVRKVSKKYRDAAKLLHILKKPNLRAFFNSLQQLDNHSYIPELCIGEIFEINVDSYPVDTTDYSSNSETLSNNNENSDDSEELTSDRVNLPSYQDAAYSYSNNDDIYPDFQIIGLQRDHKQPLGITVIKHDFEYCDTKISRCMVERILVNSIIDKQGLLQVGDIIFEINDQPVDNPNALQKMLTKLTGSINFKVIKSLKRPNSNTVNLEKNFVRALFDYDPSKDSLIPSENIGLSFSCGDVFEVLNRDDPNFWQVLPLGCTNGQALLVPSQGLQERRIALEDDIKLRSNEHGGSGKIGRRKSKKNELFRAQDAADIISEADLRTYEEVVKFPQSRVPCLLLLGPTGIGKKAIKHLTVQREPNRFAFPIQDTTEPKKGRNQPLFNHVDKNTMLSDIKSGLYVCLEENAGEVYGIKSSTIRDLINQNKTVVLDCKPKDVYSLKVPIYNPYVILIAAASINTLEAMQKEGLSRNLTKNKRTTADLQAIIDQSNTFQNMYRHLINSVVINENITKTVHKIVSIVNEVENSDSWIPASWENDIIPLPIIPKDTSLDQMKSSDDLSLNQTTTQRRFEKKNEKSSVSVLENKMIIVGKSRDKSSSENDSSDTYSDNEVVKAKPLKYSLLNKSVEDDIISYDAHEPIKPKQRVSLSRQANPQIVKGESLHVKYDPKELSKISKNPQVPLKPSIINSQTSAKLKGTAKVEGVPKTQEKTISNSKLKKDDGKVKTADRELKPLSEKEPRKYPEKNVRQVPDNDVKKVPDTEIIITQDKDKIQKSVAGFKNQRPIKNIKIKESSSSDISDTTSEDENQGLKENRV